MISYDQGGTETTISNQGRVAAVLQSENILMLLKLNTIKYNTIE